MSKPNKALLNRPDDTAKPDSLTNLEASRQTDSGLCALLLCVSSAPEQEPLAGFPVGDFAALSPGAVTAFLPAQGAPLAGRRRSSAARATALGSRIWDPRREPDSQSTGC
jgi:hypothetical protein